MPLACPRAVQALAAEQDTRASPPPPDGVGVVSICQLDPCHCSASVCPVPEPFRKYDPTAVQVPSAVQDTPDSRLRVAPAGLGVVWIVQLLPFQRSARVTSVPVLLR